MNVVFPEAGTPTSKQTTLMFEFVCVFLEAISFVYTVLVNKLINNLNITNYIHQGSQPKKISNRENRRKSHDSIVRSTIFNEKTKDSIQIRSTKIICN